jgi:hypothetical protein
VKRNFAFLIAALLTATSTLTAFASAESWYYFGFDKSAKPWVFGSEATPKDDGALEVRVKDGNGYAVLLDRSEAVVWMVTHFEEPASRVRVGFLARAISGCGACLPIVYVGMVEPSDPWQFATDFETVGEEWSSHFFELSVQGDPAAIPEHTVVAIGFTNLDGDSEFLEQQVAFDNLHVTLYGEKD